MSEELIMRLGQETLKTAVFLAGPMLAGALLIGFIISVFQAITQINEATLTFIPKIVIVAVVLVFCAPWMLDVLHHFTVHLFKSLTLYIRH